MSIIDSKLISEAEEACRKAGAVIANLDACIADYNRLIERMKNLAKELHDVTAAI